MKIIWKLLILSLFIPTAYAKTQYVTDVLYISMRDSYEDGAQTMRVIKSGTALEILEEVEEGFSKIRTPNGQEGWVKSKYLLDDPVAALQVKDYQIRVKKLNEENENLKQKYQEAKKASKEAEKERKRLESRNQVLQNDNERMKKVSARPLELSKENEELLVSNKTLEKEIAELRVENEQYKNTEGRDWFLVGAGVLFFGLVIGLIIPTIRFRKKNDWA